MSKILGSDMMLFLNGTSIAYATNHEIEIEGETSDFSCKDEGEDFWTNAEISTLNWTVTSDNIYSVDGQGENYADLFDLMIERQPIDAVFCKKAESGKDVPTGGWTPSDKPYKGKVIITDLQLNAPHGDYATYTATFTGWGELRDTAHQRYLYFEAEQDAQFEFTQNDPLNPPIQYSLDDGETWNELGIYEKTPIVQAGSRILWKGNEEQLHYRYYQEEGIGTFKATNYFKCGGNPLSIVFGDNFGSIRDIGNYPMLFHMLFYQNTYLTDSSDLELKATILSQDCYEFMFGGCTNMTKTMDVLPATRLADGCYSSMYVNCQSLTKAPKLPATILRYRCYHNMFSNCKALRESPYLPAPTLEKNSYSRMFNGCTSLSILNINATDYSAENAVDTMMNNVAPFGTIIGNANKAYTEILPTNWIKRTVSTAWIPRIFDVEDGQEVDIWRGYDSYIRLFHNERTAVGKCIMQIIESDGTVDFETTFDVLDKEYTRLPSDTMTWEDKVYYLVLKSLLPTNDNYISCINCYPVGHVGGGSPIG